jgi:hypothetical protein
LAALAQGIHALLATKTEMGTPQRNMQAGDIVLIKEENLPINCWRTARVKEAYTSDDGLVRRKVKIIVSDPSLSREGKTCSSNDCSGQTSS